MLLPAFVEGKGGAHSQSLCVCVCVCVCVSMCVFVFVYENVCVFVCAWVQPAKYPPALRVEFLSSFLDNFGDDPGFIKTNSKEIAMARRSFEDAQQELKQGA